MALKDKFTIEEMDLENKELSYVRKPKNLEAYWMNEYEQHPTNKNWKDNSN